MYKMFAMKKCLNTLKPKQLLKSNSYHNSVQLSFSLTYQDK